MPLYHFFSLSSCCLSFLLQVNIVVYTSLKISELYTHTKERQTYMEHTHTKKKYIAKYIDLVMHAARYIGKFKQWDILEI